MRRRLGVVLLASLVWMRPAPCLAQQPGDASLRVRVTDAVTQQPLVGALVTFPDLFQFWITDPSGNVSAIGIPPGQHQVEVTMPGYTPVQAMLEFEPGAAAEGDIELTPTELEVGSGPVTVRSTSTTGQGDGTLRVRVVDAMTRQPLVGANVTFPDLFRYWVTDPAGRASATSIPPGDHWVEVTAFGYGTVRARLEFAPGADAEADFQLITKPVDIEGITVTTTSTPTLARLERSGFYERSRIGLGRQITRIEIEERNASQPSDLFRSIPGVRLVPGPGIGDYTPMSVRGGLGSPYGCPMRVYLDGVRWSWTVDDLPIGWIEGLEVYVDAATIPMEFSSADETRGVILVWTR